MSTHTEDDPQPAVAAGVEYEARDARPTPVLITGLSLFVMMLCGFAGAWAFWDTFTSRELAARPSVSPVYERELPRGPLLQANPDDDWAEFEQTQMEYLDSYGYLNDEKTRAHVPVDVALKHTVAAGELPTWGEPELEPEPEAEAEAPDVEGEGAPSFEAPASDATESTDAASGSTEEGGSGH